MPPDQRRRAQTLVWQSTVASGWDRRTAVVCGKYTAKFLAGVTRAGPCELLMIGGVGRMTSWQSLLYCAAADVTLGRIRNLVAVTGTESLTIEFKEGGSTAAIPACAAAMANANGGLILVGISDQARDIVGVSREAISHVADVLATHLESPDWAPELIEVPLGDDKRGRYVLVLRINRDTAPRPVFIQGGGGIIWAPVRMPGSTRQATRDELYELFTEPQPGDLQDSEWEFNRPDIPRGRDGGPDTTVDLVMLSGLRVPVGQTAWGRPQATWRR
jgi:Schlafen, AlbA_2